MTKRFRDHRLSGAGSRVIPRLAPPTRLRPDEALVRMPGATSIHYQLVLPREDEGGSSSFFASFSRPLLHCSHVFAAIGTLPGHVLELFETRERFLRARVSGAAYFVAFPSTIATLTFLLPTPSAPFRVLLPHPDVAAAVFEAAVRHPIPSLLVDIGEARSQYLALEDLGWDSVRAHIYAVVAALKSRGEGSSIVRFVERLPFFDRRKEKWSLQGPAEYSSRRHFSTLPNDVVLRAFGARVKPGDPINPSEPQNYVDAIYRSFEDVEHRRRIEVGSMRLSFPPPHELIIWAPDMLRRYHLAGGFPYEVPPALRWGVRKALQVLRTQRGYGFLTTDRNLPRRLLDDPALGLLMEERSREILVASHVVALRASEGLVGSIRLPAGTRCALAGTDNLARCVRGMGPHRRWKSQKLFRDVQLQLAGVVAPELQSSIDNASTIKVFADVPIEWMPSKGLPLGLRASVSRVPTTPGNLMVSLGCGRPQKAFRYNSLRDVLIVRGLKSSDKLYRTLERQVVRTLGRPEGGLRYQFVDVHSGDELIDALRTRPAEILIFDGHGKWSGDQGFLCLGDEAFDTWALQDLGISMPSIVVLAACDTHPAEASHQSPANGFLSSGADTVIASLMPLDGRLAGNFVARLLLRVRDFLPLVLKQQGAIRWSVLFTGLQRMAYSSDVLFEMYRHRLLRLSLAEHFRLTTGINSAINVFGGGWYDWLIHALSAHVGLSPDEVSEWIREHACFTETLRWTQLGNPERIVITP